MVAYEIYGHDPVNGYELLGVLPERRKNPARITEGSIINWGRKFFGKSLDINGIFIFQLKTDKNTGKTSRHTPFFITQPRISNANSY
jgi:hypothetical protein